MATSGGSVIIDILANTTNFQQGVAKAEARMVTLASGARVSTRALGIMQRTGLDKTAASANKLATSGRHLLEGIRSAPPVYIGAQRAASGLAKENDNLHAKFAKAKFGMLSLRAPTLGAAAALVVGAQAFKHLQHFMVVTGDDAYTTGGKFRNAFASLTKGDVVGAGLALAAKKPAKSWQEATRMLNNYIRKLKEYDQAQPKKQVKGQRGFEAYQGNAVGLAQDKELARLKAQEKAMYELRNPSRAPGTTYAHHPTVDTEQMLRQETLQAGLPENLATAIALAQAFGTRKQQLAQLQRAEKALLKQAKQGGLTDAQRQVIAAAYASVHGEVTSAKEEAAAAAAAKKADAKAKADAAKEAARARAEAFQQSLTGVSDKLRLQQAIAEGTPSKKDDIKSALANLKQLRANLKKATSDGIRAQIVDAINATKETLKELRKGAAKGDLLDQIKAGRDNARALVDAKEELRKALMIGDPTAIRNATRDLEDATLERKKLKSEGVTYGTPVAGKGGATVIINVNGAGDADLVAQKVVKHLDKHKKRFGSGQSRGRNPGKFDR